MRMRMMIGAAVLVGLSHAALAAEPKVSKKGPAKSAVETTLPDILKKLLLSIDADPDSGAPPLKVKFTVDLYDDDLDKPAFIWNFGDGGTSKEKEPVHVFKKPGDYTVTLRMEDTHDRVGNADISISVAVPEE